MSSPPIGSVTQPELLSDADNAAVSQPIDDRASMMDLLMDIHSRLDTQQQVLDDLCLAKQSDSARNSAQAADNPSACLGSRCS